MCHAYEATKFEAQDENVYEAMPLSYFAPDQLVRASSSTSPEPMSGPVYANLPASSFAQEDHDAEEDHDAV